MTQATKTTPGPRLSLGRRALDGAAVAGALYAAAKLWPFGVAKLQGTGGSLQGFRQIGTAFGVDPTAFRLFVGAQEVAVSLALGATLLAVVLPRLLPRLLPRVTQLGALGLVATMAGALATELIVRPGQQDWLVRLALALLGVGLVLSVWALRRFGLPRLPGRALPSSPAPATQHAH